MNQPSLQACHVAGIAFQHATAEDEADLHELLRDNAMDAWIRLTMEREPHYFAGENLLGSSSTVIAREVTSPHEPVGMYTCTLQPVYLNGRQVQAGYLGGLRVHQSYRHKLRVIKAGFASIRHLISAQDQPACWYTSVGQQNDQARRLLERGLKGLPSYTCVGEMKTLAISLRKGKNHGLLRRADPHDAPALCRFFNQQAQGFQLAPLLTPSWLTALDGSNGLTLRDFWLLQQGDEIDGCVALWDQRKFKQFVIQGYRFPLDKIRRTYNLAARLLRIPQLPPAGQAIQQVFLAFFALSPRSAHLSAATIAEALYHAKMQGAEIGVLGMSERNPLLPVVLSTFRPNIYHTRIETVSWPDAPRPTLDDRPVQPEVALL